MTIRLAICGYGNLGRGVEQAALAAPDMEPVVVFTRRDPDTLETLGTPAASVDDMEQWKDRVDVCLCCGGSATDLAEQVPAALRYFPTVDSFDTHAKIPEYFASCDEAAREAGTAALISVGWDPGLFSLTRLLGQAVLPDSLEETFWGKGVSQGHSDALRRIEGVVGAVQYTVPRPEALEAVRSGQATEPAEARAKHTRECYVVAADGADRERIREEIVSMPNYFADYDTTVTFISAEELERDHQGMPHGGSVLRRGHTAGGSAAGIEFSLDLESNPQFTGAVVTACGRALYRLVSGGVTGALTLFDVPLGSLHPGAPEELRAQLL
ncbi:diaminopimelate dehydrogenase [Nanchangia anserum]|uniref:Meso-diaminopimelate D-dehydrogenase n=1 Tax=Nanchangia anserum TaxID=2692125 RepID=A0A8I0GEY5_9ACTO|nr:diaminopimelate dehydrogenase [Nanchangia anserum]MBD3689607.1 diaminopimelate dehydrogenase [Nanchangia anserum]QOX81790.1 diaminopimelate dehydrogenase [Nanchangia anserum]